MKDVLFKFFFCVAVSTVGTVVYIVIKNVVWMIDVITSGSAWNICVPLFVVFLFAVGVWIAEKRIEVRI